MKLNSNRARTISRAFAISLLTAKESGSHVFSIGTQSAPDSRAVRETTTEPQTIMSQEITKEAQAARIKTLELGQRCICSLNTLTAHRRSSDKEHAERAKRIRAVFDAINGRYQRGDLNLPGFDGLEVAPELLALINNPTQGL